MSATKNRIALQFHTMRALWNFAQVIDCKTIEIHSREVKLICDCSNEEIQLALTKYEARILEGTQATAPHFPQKS